MFRTCRLAATAVAFILSIGLGRANATTFQVTNTNNAGPGSLRQAILDSRSAPGPHVIEIDLPIGSVIAVDGQYLPPLKGPIVVRVKSATAPPPRDAATAVGSAPLSSYPTPTVTLDGSKMVRPRTPDDCPGATAAYNEQTAQWESSRIQGAGPNVRGYYGAGLSAYDTGNVQISGIAIRDFCTGIATVRSHDITIDNIRIMEAHGTAGVIFTGDDGEAGVTTASYNNKLLNSVLLDNADGLEFTRGNRDSLLQNTFIGLTKPLPTDGNAVEYATSGDNNTMIGNTMTKYVATAVTVGSGANHVIRNNLVLGNAGQGMSVGGPSVRLTGNTFTDNGADAVSVAGAGSQVIENAFTNNTGRAIVVSGLKVTISRNSIYNNGKLGIDASAGGGRGGGGGGRAGGAAPGGGRAAGAVGTPATPAAAARGVGAAAAPGQPAAPPAAPLVLPASPVIAATSRWTARELLLNGTLDAQPNQRYAVELFVSREADRHQGEEKGWGEGEKYVGTVAATTDGSGRATFTFAAAVPDILRSGRSTAFATATATDAEGSTSKFSRAVELTLAR